MTAPVEQSNQPLLTRRVWLFPVWVWFLVLVLFAAAFIYWRRRTKGNVGTGSSVVDLSGGVTQTAPTMIPYTSDIFVTVNRPEPGADNPGTQTPVDPIPDNNPAPPRKPAPSGPIIPDPPARKTTVSYTVKPNDTLSKIGGAYNVPWQSIYAANQSLIESVAQQHGWPNSNNGHWIFPGTTLMIPV